MDFKILKLDGYTPQMGNLISMMNYARKTTLDAVEGLSTADLDFLSNKDGNSIGALLAHMAAVETIFQIQTFEERQPQNSEIEKHTPALGLGDLGREQIKDNSLDHYLQILKEVREHTLQELQKRDDDWLFREIAWGPYQANHYFIWFHVFEDEINHRGQIRIIRKTLPKNE